MQLNYLTFVLVLAALISMVNTRFIGGRIRVSGCNKNHYIADRNRLIEHLKKVFSSSTISILDTDDYSFVNYEFYKPLCLLISIPPEPTPESSYPDIKNVYMTQIYTKQHFPKTHRNTTELVISPDDLVKYHNRHCLPPPPSSSWAGLVMTLIIMVLFCVFLKN